MFDNFFSELVFLRTYSRFKENGERESWDDVVERVIKFSFNLAPATERERELLSYIFSERIAFPAGRTLWIGGTKLSEQKGLANFNCCGIYLHDIYNFSELMYALMCGCGVGIRIDPERINELNKKYKYTGTKFVHKNYEQKYPVKVENTYVEGNKLIIGDSREGWSDALNLIFKFLFSDKKEEIIIVYDYIRPKGIRLKTFGGYSSGHEVLKFSLEKIISLIERDKKFTSENVADIINLIGYCVVSGGARRSAECIIGNENDIKNLKVGDWLLSSPWRSMSNNSIIFYEKPSKKKLEEIFDSIVQYGEPGFVNAEAASRRRKDFTMLNPCFEILFGKDYGLCNLCTYDISKLYNSKLNYETILRLLTRHAIRITLLKIENENFQKTLIDDRLIGISFTGLSTFLNDNPNIDLIMLMKDHKRIIYDEAKRYANYLGINEPLLKTCVKPNGTISQLNLVSEGIHDTFAPVYIRRVRIPDTNPISIALKEMGCPYEEDVYTKNTLVFSFLINTNLKEKKRKNPIELLERYKIVNKFYCDHNTSITVGFKKENVKEIIDWLDQNWDDYIAISFLPESETKYPQMPYEEYNGQNNVITSVDRKKFHEILKELDNGDDFDLDSDCANGVCPVR